MKIRAALSCLLLASAFAGAANAADNRIIFGPLTRCEQIAVDYCDKHYNQGTSGYDKCILDRFDYCNGKPSLQTNTGGVFAGPTAGVFVPVKPATKPPVTVAKPRVNGFINRN